MIVPYGKLEIINGFIIITDLGLAFMKNGLFPQGYFFLPCSVIGVILIYFKENHFTIIGYFLTYLWLYYIIDFLELKSSLPVSISLLIYVLISVYISYKIFINMRLEKS
tara:strand:- start:1273 stop:1599 length:327 start_codon:yes stop_codon:yes gene_type:complete